MNKWEKQVFKSLLDDEASVLKELERQYKAALKEVDLNIAFLSRDLSMQSRVFQMEYQKALRTQISGILDQLHSNEFTSIQNYLNECYSKGFVGTMYSIAGQGVPLIIPINQNAVVRAVMTDSKLSGSLYSALGKDIKELKRTVMSEVTRGMATGMDWKDVGRNIGMMSDIPMKRAKTIARTEGHRIQQEAAADARDEAKANGCDVLKQWDSTLDDKTRESHVALDGQIREVGEPFEVNGHHAEYPGGFGVAEEDINCRCVALTRARWGLDAAELETMKERAEFFGVDKSDRFAEYKEKYLNAAEKQ